MKKHDQPPILAYAITIFLSAFLLFQVQPMMGKMILPWFGGAASVWTACMLFFQSLLLLGYLYTHWVMRYLSAPWQSSVHIALLLLCLGLAAPSASADGIEGRVTVPRARDGRDVVVYLDRIPGKTFVPPSAPVVIDQRNLSFQPHVTALMVGTRVAFPNSDEVRHNVFSPTKGSSFDLGSYPLKTTKFQSFDKPGVVTLLCNVHAEMSAYVVVTETPYFALSDRDGRFSIPGVPAGRYVVVAWHERAGTTRQMVDVPSASPAAINVTLGR